MFKKTSTLLLSSVLASSGFAAGLQPSSGAASSLLEGRASAKAESQAPAHHHRQRMLEYLSSGKAPLNDQKFALRFLLKRSEAEREDLQTAIHENMAAGRSANEEIMAEKLNDILTTEQLTEFEELKESMKMDLWLPDTKPGSPLMPKRHGSG